MQKLREEFNTERDRLRELEEENRRLREKHEQNQETSSQT